MGANVPTITPHRQSCWSSEHWLSHCEGYRVDSESGKRLGLVERILWSEDGFEPMALVLRCGSRAADAVVVPLEHITLIRPEEERIVVLATVSAS